MRSEIKSEYFPKGVRIFKFMASGLYLSSLMDAFIDPD